MAILAPHSPADVPRKERERGRVPGAQYEVYQPSLTYHLICEGETPPLFGKYQHCAAVAHFEGEFWCLRLCSGSNPGCKGLLLSSLTRRPSSRVKHFAT